MYIGLVLITENYLCRHIFTNVYFKDIVNDEKAFMCSIAAYNTGIGNVSMTLSKTKNL